MREENAKATGCKLQIIQDPVAAAKNADFLYMEEVSEM
jgi:hypothetical protein